MAKKKQQEEAAVDRTAARVEKAVAAAIKGERARMKKAVAGIEWPEGVAVRTQYDIKRAVNAALAA